MRRLLTIVAVAVLAGCGGSKSEALPTPCTEGPGPVMKALTGAPGHVAIAGIRISQCFNRNAHGQDIEIVGTNLVSAAQQLGDRARGGSRTAALQLGYLIGAARKGTTRSGLGTEMVRRMEAETTGFETSRSEYARGLRAGLAQG